MKCWGAILGTLKVASDIRIVEVRRLAMLANRQSRV